MKQPALRTIAIHWDGNHFVVMETRNHIIQRLAQIQDIDLAIPDSWKIELKRTD